jgi:hypothetical protein
MIPLKMTLTAHHDEKLMPVAGGTKLIPPKITGQETKRNTCQRRESRYVNRTTTGPIRKNHSRLPYN